MHGSDQSYRRNNGGGTLCHAGSALRGEASPAHHISGAGSIQRRENRSNGSLSGYASRRCGRLQLVTIYNNIEVEHKTWCSAEECPCMQFMNGQISRQDLDDILANGDLVCYESQMLREWKAMAGVVQNGDRKGQPMHLSGVQSNSLCVLTTREPYTTEENRFIFAVFLVDQTYDGDDLDEGFVSTQSKYKIRLTTEQAHQMPFWRYHANEKQPEIAVWSSGLHRYFNDEQAAQILRDIVEIKKGTADEALAREFYETFCTITKINSESLSDPNGALCQ